jgi:arsenical pump membrane protein
VLVTLGVIVRPRKLPEAIWAVLGAMALVVLALVPWTSALQAIGKGIDVYLFLVGMMLLAELGRKEGLFDRLAALAVRQARALSFDLRLHRKCRKLRIADLKSGEPGLLW